MVFLLESQTLFTFHDHIINLQILQGLKFSPHEVKYKTPGNKCKCQIPYLGKYVWLTLSIFKLLMWTKAIPLLH